MMHPKIFDAETITIVEACELHATYPDGTWEMFVVPMGGIFALGDNEVEPGFISNIRIMLDYFVRLGEWEYHFHMSGCGDDVAFEYVYIRREINMGESALEEVA